MSKSVPLDARLLVMILAAASGAGPGVSVAHEAARDAAREHWAFQPPRRPPLPDVTRREAAIRNPIDVFVDREREKQGLAASPEAPRRVLVRRLYLDLTGLPPTLEELERFENDPDPCAYEKLVEALLASPRHGERWGRFWLDLARWAESDGYEANEPRPAAWRYRDYVVGAFNADKPYDQFLREQIAGDELEPYSDENLIATGFLAATRTNNNEEDRAVQLNEPLVDMANTTATVTLGLTLQCAQCHDHKFEPLSTRDYYAFHGFFVRGQVNSLLLRDPEGWRAWERMCPPELDTARTLRRQIEEPVRQRLAAEQNTKPDDIPCNQVRKGLSEDDQRLLKELNQKIDSIEKRLEDAKPQTWGFYSPATSPHAIENLSPRGQYPFSYKPEELKAKKAFTLARGDVHRPLDEVALGVPEVLTAAEGSARPTFRNRRDLVDWLVSDSNPLTARVWVNYLWQQHFGQGLVTTPGDFGTGAEPPSHPELLDWLAVELREHGWSTRHIHRLIVTSGTYRQTSRPDGSAKRIDPENRYLGRWRPRRLEAEAIRDGTLAVAGLLDPRAGGPSDRPDSGSRRRSLYLTQRRYLLPATQALFDAPTATESCPRRHVATVPLQALHLLNSEDALSHARAFAERVSSRAGSDPAAHIDLAFRLALGRCPDEAERSGAAAFLESQPDDEALIRFCQVILNLNEFVYLQ